MGISDKGQTYLKTKQIAVFCDILVFSSTLSSFRIECILIQSMPFLCKAIFRNPLLTSSGLRFQWCK